MVFKRPSEVRAERDGSPDFIVDGLVHSSVNMILGAPEAGKTFLALSLAHALTIGDQWLGHDVIGGPYRVAYVTLDAGDYSESEKRYTALHGPDEGLLLAELTEESAEWDADFANLAAHAVRVVMIDNLTALMGERDINSASDVRKVLDPIGRAARAHGLTVVVVAHTNKSAIGAGTSGHLGSQAIRAWTRNTLTLAGSGDQRTLTVRGNYGSPKTLALAFTVNGKAGLFEVTVSVDQGEQQRRRSDERLERNAEFRIWFLANVDHSLRPAATYRWLEQERGERKASAWKTFLSRSGLSYVDGKWQVKEAEASAA